jgi:hypothetical protein
MYNGREYFKSFTQTLLNNITNTGKTSDIMLDVVYEDFKKHVNEKKDYIQSITEKYMTDHQRIRQEKLFTYNTYIADKANLKNIWMRSQIYT